MLSLVREKKIKECVTTKNCYYEYFFHKLSKLHGDLSDFEINII